MDNENMKRWREQEASKTEHNADPQCDYPKDCARATVELIDEVLALRAQVTEARWVARTLSAWKMTQERGAAMKVIGSWPAPEES